MFGGVPWVIEYVVHPPVLAPYLVAHLRGRGYDATNYGPRLWATHRHAADPTEERLVLGSVIAAWRRRASRRGQEETIHVLKGQYKIQIGDETFRLAEGGFAYLPSRVPHAFLNLTDDPGEIIVVYTPGGGHKFYEELGPLTRNGTPDRTAVAAVFEKYDMTLLGPPLTAD